MKCSEIHQNKKFTNIVTIIFMVVIFSVIVYLAFLPKAHAGTADRIEVCCFWNEKLDDGILTYAVESNDKLFNKIVEVALYTWQEKMDNIISFAKVKDIDDADIRIYSEKSQKKMVEMSKEINGVNFDASKYEENESLANTVVAHIKDGNDKVIVYTEITVWSAIYLPELIAQHGFGKYTVYNALLHEIGHVFGLNHATGNKDLMSPIMEINPVDDKPLKVSNCDAHTALDQNGMLYGISESEFPAYSVFVGEHGYEQESQGYYECVK